MHRNVMNAVANFRVGVRNSFGLQSAINGLPRFSGIVRSKGTRCRNRDDYSIGIFLIENDRVQAQAAGARVPARSRTMLPQTGKLMPGLRAISRTEQRRVFDACINGVGIGERRFKMPDSREFPGMRRAVVPLMSAGDRGVIE